MDAHVFDRFARFYDEDYRHYDEDLDAVVRLATDLGGPVLELGCGTGRVLVPLARTQLPLTGVDISPALLEIARGKLGRATARVNLVQADMRTLDLPAKDFAFAFCVSNTFMHLADPSAQMDALHRAAAHLAPGGLLLLDLFHPDVARWIEVHGVKELADRWTRADGTQVLKWSVRTVDLAAQLLETLFLYEEISPAGQITSTPCAFTLRYLWRHEAELMVAAAGLTVEAVWGDFEGSPYGDDSEHLILLATKPAA